MVTCEVNNRHYWRDPPALSRAALFRAATIKLLRRKTIIVSTQSHETALLVEAYCRNATVKRRRAVQKRLQAIARDPAGLSAFAGPIDVEAWNLAYCEREMAADKDHAGGYPPTAASHAVASGGKNEASALPTAIATTSPASNTLKLIGQRLRRTALSRIS
jgi:hypothetical protein